MVKSDQQGGEPLPDGGVQQNSNITESNPPKGKYNTTSKVSVECVSS